MQKDSGVDAILSSFIRYSELSAVKYDAEKDIIKIEVALNGCIGDKHRSNFITRYRQSIALLHNMLNIEPAYMDLEFIEKSGITIMRLYRANLSLREEEIELFVLLIRQEFASLLVRDDNDMLAEAALSRDIKDTLLKKIKESRQPYQNIFAYRDEGRVFVFNK
ncbi:MAG: hypothetical protein CVU90_05715 [Firmicutes bacterium HGW-Firmicutes-15]|nr:MAG: hypothetical protein CVU90_05715 [Firmicutes bacterium HGW-Firmicutes-15]